MDWGACLVWLMFQGAGQELRIDFTSLRLACSTRRRRVVLQRPDLHDAVYHTTSRFSAHRCDVEASFHVATSSVKNVEHIRCHLTSLAECGQIPRRHPEGNREETALVPRCAAENDELRRVHLDHVSKSLTYYPMITGSSCPSYR
jgi:hypothetical protein